MEKFATITRLSIFKQHYNECLSRLNSLAQTLMLTKDILNREITDYKQEIEKNTDLFEEHKLIEGGDLSKAMDLWIRGDFLKKEYPDLILKSGVLFLYTIIENSLRRLTTIVNDTNHFKLKPKDLTDKGGELDHFKLYISKVIGINLDKVGKQWEIINETRQIRNFIAHHNGNLLIIESSSKIKKPVINRIIDKHDSLGLLNNQLIIYNEKFVINGIKNVNEFLKYLTSELEDKIGKLTVEVKYERDKSGQIQKIETRV